MGRNIVALALLFLLSLMDSTGLAAVEITKQVVENAIYRVLTPDATYTVQLKNGEYDPGTSPFEDENYVHVWLFNVKLTDLNNDGTQDAVVVLYTNTGGSSSWGNLTALISGSAEPIQVEPVILSDREEVTGISTRTSPDRSTVVCFDIRTHRPSDPLCCPTKRITRCFKLVEKKEKWFFQEWQRK